MIIFDNDLLNTLLFIFPEDTETTQKWLIFKYFCIILFTIAG